MNKISSNIKKIALSLLVVGLAVGFSAFKNTQKLALEQWHFKTGEPIGNARVPGSYELLSQIPEPTCNNFEVLPCVIQFNNSVPATSDLAEYLSGFANDADVVADTTSTRSN